MKYKKTFETHHGNYTVEVRKVENEKLDIWEVFGIIEGDEVIKSQVPIVEDLPQLILLEVKNAREYCEHFLKAEYNPTYWQIELKEEGFQLLTQDTEELIVEVTEPKEADKLSVFWGEEKLRKLKDINKKFILIWSKLSKLVEGDSSTLARLIWDRILPLCDELDTMIQTVVRSGTELEENKLSVFRGKERLVDFDINFSKPFKITGEQDGVGMVYGGRNKTDCQKPKKTFNKVSKLNRKIKPYN